MKGTKIELLKQAGCSVVLLGIITAAAALTAKERNSKEQKKISSSDAPAKNQGCQTIIMKATAYCPCKLCCGKYANNKTATGKKADKTDGVAADPRLLAYGTWLEIPGIGRRVVDDTGGAMRQSAKRGVYHIDIRMKTHKKAKNFGVKKLPVKILN